MSESPLSVCRLDLAQINDYILRADSHVRSEVVAYQIQGVYSGILPRCDLGQVHSPQYAPTRPFRPNPTILLAKSSACAPQAPTRQGDTC